MLRPKLYGAAVAMLLVSGAVLPAQAQVRLTGLELHDGCNGAPFANGFPDREELVNMVLELESDAFLRNARCEFEVIPAAPGMVDLGVTTFPGTNPGGIIGDFPPGPGKCRTTFVVHDTAMACAGSLFLETTVVSSSHPPIVLDLLPVLCTNNVAPPAVISPETCSLFLAKRGSGILFSWTPADDTDRFNLYRGDLADFINGFPDLVAAGVLGIGFCSNPGTVVAGALPCSCTEPGSCTADPFHFEFEDPFEDPFDFVYKISGEKDCLAPGEGAEGTLGSYGSGEHPYGGGFCPPM